MVICILVSHINLRKNIAIVVLQATGVFHVLLQLQIFKGQQIHYLSPICVLGFINLSGFIYLVIRYTTNPAWSPNLTGVSRGQFLKLLGFEDNNEGFPEVMKNIHIYPEVPGKGKQIYKQEWGDTMKGTILQPGQRYVIQIK